MKLKKTKKQMNSGKWCELKIQEGQDLYRQCKYRQAEIVYREILSHYPNNPDANCSLGLIALVAGNHSDAIQLISKAINLSRKPHFLYNLALAYKGTGDYAQALECFLGAIDLQPNYPAASIWAASLYRSRGNIAAAKEVLIAALEFDSKRIDLHQHLGACHEYYGDFDESIRCYEKIIEINKQHGWAYKNIVSIKKYNNIEELDDVVALYKNMEDGQEKAFTGFAIGKVLEDFRQYSSAFEYFKAANTFIRNTYDYEIEEEQELIVKIKDVFTKEFFLKNKIKANNNGRTPVFIVGMPRSGTTLVEQIISAHSQVTGLGELQDLSEVTNNKLRPDGFPLGVSYCSSGDFLEMREDYLHRTSWLSHESTFYTDKMPQNFLFVGLIKIILPEAKIIHCRREPMDTCWSVYKMLFSQPHKYAQDQVELGKYYKIYEGLMEYWHSVIPGFVLDVDYQEIVADTDEQIARILDFCGLQHEEACKRFYEKDRVVGTSSSIQVRKPIYSSAINFWHNYEKHLDELKKILWSNEV